MSHRVSIDVPRVVAWIGQKRIEELDGLHAAIDKKMKELGVPFNKRAAPDVDGNGNQSGNERSVLRFVESLVPPVDTNAVDKTEAEAAGKKYVANEEAATRYKVECERFEEDKQALQALHACISRRYALAGRTLHHEEEE